MEENITIFANWEVNYGAELPKFFNWWEVELAQKFVLDKDVESIIFYTTGLTDTVGGIAHETKRIDIATLTKEKFANVNCQWIDERMKEQGVTKT
jgi:hypothetical protein